MGKDNLVFWFCANSKKMLWPHGKQFILDITEWSKANLHFQCILQVRRYFPVANLTRTRQAVILEAMRPGEPYFRVLRWFSAKLSLQPFHIPERFFVRTFNATSLYILSVCEVCGSYQCPYCPTFSAASPVLSEMTLVAATALAFLLVANAHIWLLDVRFYRKT